MAKAEKLKAHYLKNVAAYDGGELKVSTCSLQICFSVCCEFIENFLVMLTFI